MNLSEHDAYALRRAVAMLDVPDDLVLSPLVAALLKTLKWKDNSAHWSLLQQILTSDPAICTYLLQIDPHGAVPMKTNKEEVTYVPLLPAAAQLSDALLARAELVGHFHRDCMAWLSKRSPMTPRLFLESGPLWVVGLAVARRCVLRLGFGDIYPNLYYLWVAPTTYFHKSTGLNAITDMVRDSIPHLLLPATTSPKMLVAKLAGERPANYEKLLPFEQRLEDLAVRFAGQRGIIIDMFEVEGLKRSIDCRELIERDLGQPKYRGREYNVYKCPLHQERKGYSFVVYADHWRCFGKCRTAGDVIGWLMRYHGLSFRAACERLGAGSPTHYAAVLRPARHEEPFAQPPDERWQKVARRIADEAADWLWSRQGRRALRYLKEARGLKEGIIAAARLGFIPGDPHAWQEIDELGVPCGITIPWHGDGARQASSATSR